MSMHLEGPWLSTTGKRKGKQKFRTSAEAQKSRELADEWKKKQQEWAAMSPGFSKGLKVKASSVQTKRTSPVVSGPALIDPARDHRRIPSRDTGEGIAALAPQKVYTGTKIKGIGTMHKSNSVPIFSDEDAVAIAHMRR